jgi:hypothetical protein
MSTTTQDATSIQQAHATVRSAARRVPTATRPLYRHARTALQTATRQMAAVCLTQADDTQALLLGTLRLEQALIQRLRFQGHALRRRGQHR